MSKTTDKSHLSDAIYLAGLIHLIDEDIPVANATIEQSKAAATQAQSELEEHQRWLVDHQERYAEAVKECQRRLKRRRIIHGCKQTALLPKRLLASGCLALWRAAWAYPHRLRLRPKLQKRIRAMDRFSESRVSHQ
jgi:hypothetical protein